MSKFAFLLHGDLATMVCRSACLTVALALCLLSHGRWWQTGAGVIFLAFAACNEDFIPLALSGLAAATIYAFLIPAFYARDRSHMRKAPYARLRYFLGRTPGECLICHEDARDPALLS